MNTNKQRQNIQSYRFHVTILLPWITSGEKISRRDQHLWNDLYCRKEMTKTLKIFFGLHECVTYFSYEPIYPPLFNGQHFCQNLGHKDKKVCRIMWLSAVGLGLLTVIVTIFCDIFFLNIIIY